MRARTKKKWTPDRLQRLMDETGLEVNELAAAVGCHQVSVQRWLRGERQPIPSARKTLERLEAQANKRGRDLGDISPDPVREGL